MAEQLITNTSSDALSRLIQLQARRYDVQLAWTGKGIDDLTAMLNAHAAKARLAKHLWTGMRELMQMPELLQLPEPVQAKVMSIILKSQVLVDLDTDAHAKRMAAATGKPYGAA